MSNNSWKKALGGGLFVTLIIGVEEVIRRNLRKKGQEDLQKIVDESYNPKKEESHDEVIKYEIVTSDDFDISNFTPIDINIEEADEWKSLFSTIVGESTKAGLNVTSINGLLKCDIPINELYRIKDNPNHMRGYVVSDGKFAKQGVFTEVGLEKVAPLMVYQCMAAITSQYYQQIITERLNTIDFKIDQVQSILLSHDSGTLKVAYNWFVEWSKKNKFSSSDMTNATRLQIDVEKVRETYREQLSKIKIAGLKVYAKATDKKEVEAKIAKLEDSKYFEYLEMVMQSEVMVYIASAITTKIAAYLGDTENMELYANKMSLDYWDNYKSQFQEIKHDVLKYIELQKGSSWFNSNEINLLLKKYEAKFNSKEESMLKLQEQFDCHTTQYVVIEEDGSVHKYIEITKK